MYFPSTLEHCPLNCALAEKLFNQYKQIMIYDRVNLNKVGDFYATTSMVNCCRPEYLRIRKPCHMSVFHCFY